MRGRSIECLEKEIVREREIGKKMRASEFKEMETNLVLFNFSKQPYNCIRKIPYQSSKIQDNFFFFFFLKKNNILYR